MQQIRALTSMAQKLFTRSSKPETNTTSDKSLTQEEKVLLNKQNEFVEYGNYYNKVLQSIIDIVHKTKDEDALLYPISITDPNNFTEGQKALLNSKPIAVILPDVHATFEEGRNKSDYTVNPPKECINAQFNFLNGLREGVGDEFKQLFIEGAEDFNLLNSLDSKRLAKTSSLTKFKKKFPDINLVSVESEGAKEFAECNISMLITISLDIEFNKEKDFAKVEETKRLRRVAIDGFQELDLTHFTSNLSPQTIYNDVLRGLFKEFIDKNPDIKLDEIIRFTSLKYPDKQYTNDQLIPIPVIRDDINASAKDIKILKKFFESKGDEAVEKRDKNMLKFYTKQRSRQVIPLIVGEDHVPNLTKELEAAGIPVIALGIGTRNNN